MGLYFFCDRRNTLSPAAQAVRRREVALPPRASRAAAPGWVTSPVSRVSYPVAGSGRQTGKEANRRHGTRICIIINTLYPAHFLLPRRHNR